MTALGLVTIGQAPRVDLIADVADELANVTYVEHGALDLLETQDIARLAPRPGERPLVSRLRDGTGVRIGATDIADHVDDAIRRCVDDSCGLILVLCTGRVEHGTADVPVIHAEELAHATMSRWVGGDTLGVLCPVPEQLPDLRDRWFQRLGRPVLAAAADPYSASVNEITTAGLALADAGADLIFLDCIGYTKEHQGALAAAGAPAYLARRLAVRGAVEALRTLA